MMFVAKTVLDLQDTDRKSRMLSVAALVSQLLRRSFCESHREIVHNQTNETVVSPFHAQKCMV